MGGCSAAAARSTPVLVGRPRPSLRSSASLSLLSVSAAASAVCRIAHFAFPSVRLPRAAASLPPSLCSSPWEPTALTAGGHGGALKGGPLWQAADLLGSWVTKPRPQTWGWAELSPFPPWTGSRGWQLEMGAGRCLNAPLLHAVLPLPRAVNVSC